MHRAQCCRRPVSNLLLSPAVHFAQDPYSDKGSRTSVELDATCWPVLPDGPGHWRAVRHDSRQRGSRRPQVGNRPPADSQTRTAAINQDVIDQGATDQGRTRKRATAVLYGFARDSVKGLPLLTDSHQTQNGSRRILRPWQAKTSSLFHNNRASGEKEPGARPWSCPNLRGNRSHSAARCWKSGTVNHLLRYPTACAARVQLRWLSSKRPGPETVHYHPGRPDQHRIARQSGVAEGHRQRDGQWSCAKDGGSFSRMRATLRSSHAPLAGLRLGGAGALAAGHRRAVRAL